MRAMDDVRLQGTWRRGGPVAWFFALMNRRPGRIYRYVIDWDAGVVHLPGRTLPLAEAQGVWLTQFNEPQPRGSIEITFSGLALQGVLEDRWSRCEEVAPEIAQRCGCPLHRTN